MNIINKALRILAVVVFAQQLSFSQTCPSINAQAGTGASTTICSGQCANLTASVVPVNATTSYSVGSITYNPFPFSGGTQAISNVADDIWSNPINIGFNFCYFGNTFNQLLVGANGEITFSTTIGTAESWSVSAVLPNLIDHPGNTICGPYRDINPSDVTSSVNYYVTGTAPCRAFVAYWNNAPLFQCITPRSTFQIVLYEGSNIIEMHILNSSACNTWQGGKGLIGIQDATGTTAVAPASRNVLTAWSAANESWRFVPTGTPNYTVNWSGPSGFSASGLTAAPCPTATSNYTATMNVSNCGGGSSTYTSIVQVSVTPTPTLVASSSSTAICTGSTATLTASGATSYTWNPGALTGASVAVSPTTTTIYTVTGLSNNCSSSQTISLIVNSNPTITATRSPSLICGSGSSTLTSTGASTYTWNPGALVGNTVVVSPTVTTVYTVIATSSVGCTATRTTNVIFSNTPTITANSSSSVACAGSTVSLSASGGTSYTWTPGPKTGATVVVTPTVNTTYTVTGRNAAGCTSTNTVAILVTPGITVTPVATPTSICAGSSSTLTATGATTYTWNPGALTGSNVVVSPTVNTTYSVTGSDPSGCTNTRTVTVRVNTPIITATRNPSVVCPGGSSTVTATGASTYTWLPSGTTGSSVVLTPTTNTTYTVAGTNTLGCVGTRTFSILVSINPTVTAIASSPSLCPGGSTSLTASGAITYTWLPGSITGSVITVTPSTSTNYTVTGRNVSGCTSSSTVDVVVYPSVTITPTAATSTLICSGSSETLTATGALTYTWNPGNITGSSIVVTPTSNTTYSVVGTASTGCTSSSTIAINISTVSITATSSPTSLCSSTTATLSASGASTYTWNPGGLNGTTVTVSPTVTTVYTVTGTNTVGCVATRTLNLIVGTTPTVTATSSSTNICSGTTITLTASGATTYTWLPGNIVGASITRTPTTSTTYTVRANSGGCIGTNTVFVQVNPNPTILASSNPTVICPGNPATLTASGALTYTWNPGSITSSSFVATPTITTVYTVVATSSLGCIGSSTVNLKVNPTPTINATTNPTAICAGATATLTATGALTFTWNPGALTGSSITVTPTTTSVYTVTGSTNGCSSTQTVSLIVNPLPTIMAGGAPPNICPGKTSTLAAMGAATYTWMPGSLVGMPVTVTPTITTTYTVTGTDLNGCTDTETVTITTFPSPTVTASSNPTVLCSSGSATLTASGLNNYDWMPGSLNGATAVVTPTATTIYTVSGNSTFGCAGSATVAVNVSSNPTVTASSSSSIICSGNSATLTGNGATTYTWNPGNFTGTTVVVTPTANTTYTVTGANALGCSATNTIAIGISSNPTITPIASPTAICSGSSSTLTASGGATYTWTPGAITGSSIVVTPTTNTTYTVTGSDALGCNSSNTISLLVNAVPVISATSNPSIICSGGSSTLTASGASTYTWMPGNLTGTSIVVSPTVTTTYSISGTNSLSCIGNNTISINVGTNPTLTLSTSNSSVCAGSSTTLSASGASSYTWMPGNITGTSIAVSPTINTTYTATGANASGCTATQTILITVAPTPTVSASASNTMICSGSSIVLSASGATNYTWMPGSINGAITIQSPSVTTVYTVTADNGGLCVGTNTVQVIVNTTPTVTAVSNPSILCSGGSATLTASGATNYVWNPGGAISNSIVVTPTITTDYTVSGVTGLCSNSVVITVSVGTIPTITATATTGTICAGVTETLTASGAASYTWMPGNLSGASVTVTPTSNTTYTITGDNGTGCTSTSTLDVTVNSNPTVTAVAATGTICAGVTETLTASGATSYTWMPGNLTGTSVTVTPTINTTYTVTGDNGTGCTSTSTVGVIVNSNPNVTAVAVTGTICAGVTETLTASGATSYTWMPGNLTGTSVTVTPTINTTYTVTGDNGTGCTSTSTVDVVVNSNPTVTAVAATGTICAGVTETLTASGATSYTWMPGNLTGTSVSVNPSSNSTFTVTGDNGLGCTSSSTVDVVVLAAPSISVAASATSLCGPASVTLTASGAINYTWAPSGNTGATSVENPTITTTYTVTGDNGTCSASQTITINVGTPTISIASSPSTLCVGATATLTASGAATYTWLPGNLTGASITDAPSVNTTYTVTGDDGTGCTSTNTFVLTVSANPTVTAVAATGTICAGVTETLTASGATSYTWMPGNLTGTSVSVNPSSNTTFTVTGDNGLGCTSTSTVNVVVLTAPSISVAASATTLCGPASVTLTASGATNYTWTPSGNIGATSVENPTITTTYTVTGDNGTCSASQTITINVGTPTISIASSPSTLCVGATATLTASGAATYTWLPGNLTGASITDAPSVNTTYTVTGDDGTGCTSTNTFVLTVSANPTVTAIAATGTICAGVTETLTASGAATYTWLPGNLTGTSVSVNPSSNTTFTVTGDNGLGCTSTSTVDVVVLTAPSISVAASATTLCGPASVTLTASGATNYTWTPSGNTGATSVENPTITTTYTVTGDNGTCSSSQTITINVGTTPTISIVGTPTNICVGTTATLTASGAATYTWLPNNLSGSSINDAPITSTTYTVIGDDGLGCTSSNTYVLNVTTGGPTITVVSNPTTVCSGSTSTLTASGATTYTWLATGDLTATTVVTPTTTTNYTVLGDNGVCVASATVDVFVTPGPSGVTATSSGSISCLTSTVDLFSSTTSTNSVSYSWNGPSLFTSTAQNPTGINVPGDYTVTVTESPSGCSTSSVVTVIGNTVVPDVTASASASLGCNSSVTITAVSTSTSTLNYSWSGPSTYTAAVQSPTTAIAGDYTVTITDAINGCSNTATLTVSSNTNAPVISATVIAATCSGTVANNDGTILISGFSSTDVYDLVQANTYTGSATYATAVAIPTTGVITNTLNNPATATPYTIRVFGNNGCFTDVTVTLNPTNCSATPTVVLGLTKAVGTPTFVNNNAYNVTYTIVAVNTATTDLTNFNVFDNLSNTFPAPSTFSVIGTASVTSQNSSLSINPSFDGSTQTNITSSSTLLAGKQDTIVFTVQINPNGFYGPFNNSAVGFGSDNIGTIVSDSSNTGFSWDPDGDGNPTNNNIPTTVNLTPNTSMGVAKSATVSAVLDDKTVDVTFTIIVQNLGNDTIKNLQVNDSLMIPSPAQFYVKSGPTTSTSLTANALYNGVSNIALLNGLGQIAPGTTETITIVVNVKPDTVSSFYNSAIASGIGSLGNTVRDSSHTGNVADPNGNGIATEQGENTPTLVELPDVDLFIPEVFTPDGDGKNDFFVIKGISGRNVKLTVFNRWGNMVYQNATYDNTWDGVPNVSGFIMGSGKLPQGTYYYIVEFEDGKDETVKGYVVLQY